MYDDSTADTGNYDIMYDNSTANMENDDIMCDVTGFCLFSVEIMSTGYVVQRYFSVLKVQWCYFLNRDSNPRPLCCDICA